MPAVCRTTRYVGEVLLGLRVTSCIKEGVHN